MIRVLAALACLAAAGQAGAQSCYSSSRSYGYSRSYSYAPSYSYYAPPKVYKEPAYKEVKKVEAVYTNFLLAFPVVALPSYGAAYQEPPPAPVPGQVPPNGFPPNGSGSPPNGNGRAPSPGFEAQVLRELKSLGEGMNNLNQRVERLERTRAPIPERQPKEPSPKEKPPPKEDDIGKPDPAFIAANTASCAACHQRGQDTQGKSIPDEYGGGFVLTESDGRLARLTADQREEVQRQLQKGKMPMLNTKRAKDAGVKPLTKEGADAIFAALDRQIAAGGRKARKEDARHETPGH